ncbi:MAG: FAD-dependent monooxygenase [Armatimonadota bacterium]|nr:FAD-dependent monooxygenase [Armatimonadota bacterium]
MPEQVAAHKETEPCSAPVIIAGAGPVGLALALGLAQHGVRSIVLESKKELAPHSRAIGILARTLEIFRAWQCLDRFLDEGSFLSKINVWVVGQPAPQATIDFTSLARLTAVPGVLFLPQDRTEAILLEHVNQTGMVEVCFEHELQSFEQDATGVTVQVARGGQELVELRGEYLIGCDGARSTVRTQLGWPLEGKTYPSRMLLADVRLTDERDRLPSPRIAPQPRGVLAAIQYKPQFWRIISSMTPEESEVEAVSETKIDERVARLFGPGSYERVWASVFHIHCRTSPHFRQGRVLLAGDAAHINSPAGGQGMNSGIQDAHNLAWKLARTLRGGNAEALLASYEQERRAVVLQSVDRFTDLLTRLMLMPWPYVRGALLRLVRFAIARPAVMSQVATRAMMLDVHYETSALICGTGRWRGARAPDGELIDGAGHKLRLLDLVHPQAALLLFDDGHLPDWSLEQVASLVSEVPELKVVRLAPHHAPVQPGALRDATGQLWKTWEATGDLAALIRPDGHVGWTARRPTPESLRAGVKQAVGMF